MKYIFGPVPSRRLGYSLGIDMLQRKICSLDCVYCQVGKTVIMTTERREWVDPRAVLEELKRALSTVKHVDYITFSGSGEPTLNSALGQTIRAIKAMCDIPVAVITNGTLLHVPDVRQDLMKADLVVPSLDTVDQDMFLRLNNPHRNVSIERMIEGLEAFRKSFSGRLWLEVMIVKGFNDRLEALRRVGRCVAALGVDRIQLNSVSRPSHNSVAQPVENAVLEQARAFFGQKAEIIDAFPKEKLPGNAPGLKEQIFKLVCRRPSSITQLSASLGARETDVARVVRELIYTRGVEEVDHEGRKFYRGATGQAE